MSVTDHVTTSRYCPSDEYEMSFICEVRTVVSLKVTSETLLLLSMMTSGSVVSVPTYPGTGCDSVMASTKVTSPSTSRAPMSTFGSSASPSKSTDKICYKNSTFKTIVAG